MKKFQTDRRRLIAILVAIAALVFVLIFLSSKVDFEGGSIDQLPEDGIALDTYRFQAVILEGGPLLAELGSLDALDDVAKDLYVFGSNVYEKYREADNPIIGFKIIGIKNIDGRIEIAGRFGASKNKISMTITPLKNNRIKGSITDTATGNNFDNELPSNSKKNLFIGSLPIVETGYEIDYVESDDFFTINVFNSSNNFEAGKKRLFEGLGANKDDGVRFVRYGVGDVEIENGF